MPEAVDAVGLGLAQSSEPARAVVLPPAPEQKLPQSQLSEFAQATFTNAAARTLLAEAARVDIESHYVGKPNAQVEGERAVTAAFVALRQQCPTIWDVGTALEAAKSRLNYGMGDVIKSSPMANTPVQESLYHAGTAMGKYAQEVYQQYGTPISDKTREVILDKFKSWAAGGVSHDMDFYVQEMAICATAQNLTAVDAQTVLNGIEAYRKYNRWAAVPITPDEKDRHSRLSRGLTHLQLVASGRARGDGRIDGFESTFAPNSAEKPASFKDTVDKVWDLVQQDQYARDLVLMLKQRSESWNDSNIAPNQAEAAPLLQRDVMRVVSWLVRSPDIANWGQVSGILESDIARTVDRQGLGQQYRGSADKLIESLRPFLVINKEAPIASELSYWENSHGFSGGQCLVDRAEIEQRYKFSRVEKGRYVFYVPDNQPAEQIATRFDQINKKLMQLVGQEGTKRVHVLLVPDGKYCPRGGFAKPDGGGFILSPSNDLEQVYAHEAIHAELGQIYGASKSATASEGAAMYLARAVNPADMRNDYVASNWGDQQIAHISRNGGEVGLSHTGMIDASGTPHTKDDYEYAYKFGGLLTEFIVAKAGLQAYLNFYERTCMPNLYDSDSGQPLVINGQKQPGVGERDINAQALKAMATRAGRPDLRPENILKEFTAFAAARNAKGAF